MQPRSDILSEIVALEVMTRRAEFEDGRIVETPPFQIARDCISIGLFQKFQDATGYVTTAEAENSKNLLDNELIWHVNEADLPAEPAFCVSPRDAISFCDWAGVRLPTEAEWLAASVVDYRIYSEDEFSQLFHNGGMEQITNHPEALNSSPAAEVTCTMEGDQYVLRHAPQHCRREDWAEAIAVNRPLHGWEKWDLMTAFRVCV